MFHFAFPLFLTGACLLAVPLLLHFLKKHPQQIQKFPSFYFLKQSVIRKKSRNDMRSWLVLLLRLLGLLCLIAAFAWPYFGAPEKNPACVTVIICDASYSTRDPDFQKTLDNLLDEELKKVSPKTPAVGILSADKLFVSGDLCGDGNMLRHFFEKRLEITPTANDFSLALYRADRILSSTMADKRKIVVLTDRQKLPWKHLPEETFLHAANEVEIKPDFLPVRTNARIVSAKRRDGRITAELICTGQKELAAELQILNGKRLVSHHPLVLLPGKSKSVITTLEKTEDVMQPLQLHLVCKDDAFDGDNDFFLAPPPLERRNIQLYSSVHYPALSAAFDSPEITYVEAEKWDGTPDLLLIGDSPLSEPEDVFNHAENMLQSGATVAVLYSEMPFMKELFRRFGAFVETEESVPETVSLNMLDLEHPVFREYQDLGSASWFDLLFFRLPKIKFPSGTHVLASSEGDRPLIAETIRHNGKLFFFSFVPGSDRTNFQTSGHFLPFWREMLEYGAAQRHKRTAFTAANKTVRTPDGDLDLRKPGNVRLKDTVYSINTDRSESETELLPNGFSVQTKAENKPDQAEKKNKTPSDSRNCMILLLCALICLLAELGISNRTALS